MAFSAAAKKSASKARSIKALLGESAYQAYKRTGHVDESALAAARAKKAGSKAASKASSGKTSSPSTSSSKKYRSTASRARENKGPDSIGTAIRRLKEGGENSSVDVGGGFKVTKNGKGRYSIKHNEFGVMGYSMTQSQVITAAQKHVDLAGTKGREPDLFTWHKDWKLGEKISFHGQDATVIGFDKNDLIVRTAEGKIQRSNAHSFHHTIKGGDAPVRKKSDKDHLAHLEQQVKERQALATQATNATLAKSHAKDAAELQKHVDELRGKVNASTAARRGKSLIDKIINFDGGNDSTDDPELLQKRTFALQKLDDQDLIAAVRLQWPKKTLSDALDELAGHMDSRNHSLMKKLNSLAARERGRRN